MCLSALVFNFRNSITSSADLVQIMNIGNNMYSALSQSAKQGLLLLTDLSCMVNLCNINYQLTYSESYSGLLNSFALPIITDFPMLHHCQLPLIVWLGKMDHVYVRHLSTECRSILSADMATDTRPIYRPTLGRYVG